MYCGTALKSLCVRDACHKTCISPTEAIEKAAPFAPKVPLAKAEVEARRAWRKTMLTPTVDNINRMLSLALADPAGKQALSKDWRAFMATHFALSEEQQHSVQTASGLPADRVQAIQNAITNVVENGGAIRLSGTDPVLLVIRPEKPAETTFSCTIQIKTFVCHLEG